MACEQQLWLPARLGPLTVVRGTGLWIKGIHKEKENFGESQQRWRNKGQEKPELSTMLTYQGSKRLMKINKLRPGKSLI